MQIIADFHIHSKYARATSERNDIQGLAEGAKIKGIDLMVTGDFTHPKYFEEIKAELEPYEKGIYVKKGTYFILGTEVSVIYKKDRLYKMHHLILAPDIECAEQINETLGKYGKLSSDGRPILSMSSAELADQVFSCSKEAMIIPAHAWTPWFALFGSKSGVDNLKDAFEEHWNRIYAIETGLSSDPAMNWLISELDNITLISNSDAHSLGKLGREANVFDIKRLTYSEITKVIKTREGFVKTFEFYPEEGKYHYDGHRKCGIVLSPEESEKYNNLCPKCGKPLTLGVLHRVMDLADRKTPKKEGKVPFEYIVPLQTIISKVLKKGETTVSVLREYRKILEKFGNEFAVFEASEEEIKKNVEPKIAKAILRVKQQRVSWRPGYDGVFGELKLEEKQGRLI